MADNAQSRKWTLTINNPLDAGLTHDAITEILTRFAPDYFCMADEIATTGTFHTHVFLFSSSPIRFSTLKGRFPIAHIEKAYGSGAQNRDYITKSGKWAEDGKADTSVEGSFFEQGALPSEKEEKCPQMCRLIRHIREGRHTAAIIDDAPGLAFRVREIDTLRQTLLAERYAAENRELTVTYLYGATGTGKTRGIYQRHDPHDVCRITNYRGGRGVSFDSYSGQDVLVFEEYNSQIPIEDMLNYLDVYPLNLPARYNDKTACYTQVYITSNLSLTAQYLDVQRYRPETWRAFLRRITHVVEYRQDGTIKEATNEEKENRYRSRESDTSG
ncbi:MAG: viral replication protein [Clostridiales bacterium]|nr:viral replication protein [Clostridiales bacterium]